VASGNKNKNESAQCAPKHLCSYRKKIKLFQGICIVAVIKAGQSGNNNIKNQEK
jgi:hypothetical protein